MYKQFFVIIALVAATLVGAQDAWAQAESYQVWRIDTGLSVAHAPGTGAYGGGGVAEFKFNALDQVSAGFRFEGVLTFGGNFGLDGGDQVSVGVGAVAATLLKGEVFLTKSVVRPFAGLGLGMYTIAGQSVDANGFGAQVEQQAGRYFGLAPQLGFNFGRFRLAATYNWIVAADVEVRQMVGAEEQVTKTSQNYLSIDLAVQFGGHRTVAPQGE